MARERARAIALFDVLPEWNSPLTPGVQLVNFSHSEDGTVLRAALGADWARMFSDLRLAGAGLVMTCNDAAAIVRRMPMPALHLARGNAKAVGDGGGLLLDFRQLGVAYAVHRRNPGGHVFGVEFRGESGQTIHRFTVTPESDMDEFFAWVRLHQACSAHTSVAWMEDEETQAPETVCPARQCNGEVLESIVSACIAEELPIRVIVKNTAATQREEFIPRAIQRYDEWWFASDDTHGFHFQPDAYGSVRLETGPCGNRRIHAVSNDRAGSVLIEGAGDEWQRILDRH